MWAIAVPNLRAQRRRTLCRQASESRGDPTPDAALWCRRRVGDQGALQPFATVKFTPTGACSWFSRAWPRADSSGWRNDRLRPDAKPARGRQGKLQRRQKHVRRCDRRRDSRTSHHPGLSPGQRSAKSAARAAIRCCQDWSLRRCATRTREAQQPGRQWTRTGRLSFLSSACRC